MGQKSFHEAFDRDTGGGQGSNRAFGLTVGGALLALGVLRALTTGAIAPLGIALWVTGGILVALGSFYPGVLAPLNAGWTKFSLLLSRMTNPVFIGLIFALAIVPLGFLMRVLRKDPLHLRRQAAEGSYWIRRTPPGPPPETMKHQF